MSKDEEATSRPQFGARFLTSGMSLTMRVTRSKLFVV